MPKLIGPERARIFRIVHRNNLPWILETVLHCRSSNKHDPNFVSIGNPDLIHDRQFVRVPIPPGGTLRDYVPFYFTPYSVMLYNIHTGHRGIPQRANDEIAILVSSLPRLSEDEIRFVFTDRHARLATAEFFDDMDDLDRRDMEDTRKSLYFKRDNNDLGKMERYQAETSYTAIYR